MAARRYLLLSSLLLPLAAPSYAQTQAFDVTFRDELLSVLANDANIGNLAEALTDETGVLFSITGDPTTLVTVEIVEEPLDKAAAKLSPNHLLIHDSEAVDAPIIQVVLMLNESTTGASAAGNSTEFLPSGAPADELVPDAQLLNSEPVDGNTAPDRSVDDSSLQPQNEPVPPQYPNPAGAGGDQ